ncbi:MAG: glycosyltransferase [Bacteroidales bacterium]|nr:glycosyltransferase [Bacteroidales bacterium]
MKKRSKYYLLMIMETQKEIYVLTTNFPYGSGEPFLYAESSFLSKRKEKVHFLPIWKDGEQRSLPSGFVVEKPLLDFNPKGNPKLILKGVFCFSPFFFAIPVFFEEKAWKGKKRFWDFMTSWLLIRAMYSSWSVKLDEDALLYSYWGDKSALLLPLLKKRFHCKCISRFHGTDIYEEACGGYKPFRRWLYNELDVVIPISENGKRYLQDRYGINAPKMIEVHRLGVFDHGLNPEKEETEFHIVSCSNIVPVKRVPLLAEAIGKLDFKVRWTHIGDGPLRSEVEFVAEKYPEYVTCELLGVIPNAQVIRYYAEHHVDLFVNASRSEGVPVSIMEAFSFGIPVIATDVGGLHQVEDRCSTHVKEAVARCGCNSRPICAQLVMDKHFDAVIHPAF